MMMILGCAMAHFHIHLLPLMVAPTGLELAAGFGQSVPVKFGGVQGKYTRNKRC